MGDLLRERRKAQSSRLKRVTARRILGGAAGIVALYSAGIYEGEEIKKGLAGGMSEKFMDAANKAGMDGGAYSISRRSRCSGSCCWG